MSYLTTGGLGKEHGTNKLPTDNWKNLGKTKERGDTSPCVLLKQEGKEQGTTFKRMTQP